MCTYRALGLGQAANFISEYTTRYLSSTNIAAHIQGCCLGNMIVYGLACTLVLGRTCILESGQSLSAPRVSDIMPWALENPW